MGLGISLVTFVPATLIKSTDINTNFANLNNAVAFNGGVSTMNFEAGKVTSDGNGNLHLANGQIGQTSAGDILDASGATDLYIKASGVGGSISFLVDSILTMTITTTGLTINQGGLLFTAGPASSGTSSKSSPGTIQTSVSEASSLSRTSLFTGTATGTYNHGNGGVPDICFPICTVSNTQSGNNFDSATSTTVHIFDNAANAFSCYCMGF